MIFGMKAFFSRSYEFQGKLFEKRFAPSKVKFKADDGEEREYSIPKGLHVNVQEGEWVKAGDAFTDGPKDPHNILEILGERELQEYLLDRERYLRVYF